MTERNHGEKHQELSDNLKNASRMIENIWRQADISSEEALAQAYESVEAILSQGTGRDLVIALFEKKIDTSTWDMVYAGLYHYKEFHLPKGLPKLPSPDAYFVTPQIKPRSSFSDS